MCSKIGKTPGCKGNGIMRSVVGKYHPDWGAENARQKREKERSRDELSLCTEKIAPGSVGTDGLWVLFFWTE